ncbi:MAG: hypothetical protein GXC94_21325, partial [Comamonadaceae bacterium]|nr:hypothetical protein [Comamonadaceae bacterium]
SRDGGRPAGKPQAHAGHGGAKPAGAHTGHGGAKPAPKPHAQHAPRAASSQPSRGDGGAPRHNNGPRLTQPKR